MLRGEVCVIFFYFLGDLVFFIIFDEYMCYVMIRFVNFFRERGFIFFYVISVCSLVVLRTFGNSVY